MGLGFLILIFLPLAMACAPEKFVFIYEENASGIKRWTDGVTWTN